MVRASEKTKNVIYKAVKKDLEPGILSVLARIAASFAVGGLLSMFICGQFGIGFSEMARNLNHTMHHHAGPVVCSLFCGAVFAVLPVSLLRLSCSGVMFRKISRQYRIIPAGLLTGLAVVVYANNSVAEKLISMGAWAASGILTYYLLSALLDRVSALSTNPQTMS